MSDKTTLGDRMKTHEQVTRAVLPRRTYTILRVDGRAFHTFLGPAERPFDQGVIDSMDIVAQALCKEISGAVFAYTQSDECSVLITDFGSPHTEPWFGGVIQKMTSIAASVASTSFNRRYDDRDHDALFDARVFTLPNLEEVANYFIWRQRDCIRNAITMAAQAVFSHRELHRKNTGDMVGMLAERGITWENYPDEVRRGRVCVRRTWEGEVTYTDKRSAQPVTTTVIRKLWGVEAAPVITAAPGGWLDSLVPHLPDLRHEVAHV